jgi:hypothetical protein
MICFVAVLLRTLSRLTVLLVAAGTLWTTASAASDPAARQLRRYLAAIAAAQAGERDAAIEQLAALGEERPDWVAVHLDLSRLALADEETARTWRSRFFQRVRRSARDVGAGVGLALLEQGRGRTREAHRLLLTALTAGSRDPRLVPLLLDTTNDPAGLLDWLDRRMRVIPGDADFATLEARALLQVGRVRAAREKVAAALEEDPEHPGLLTLSTALHRAAGEEREACRAAQVALGFLGDQAEEPEVAVPRRIELARALVACGRLAEAEQVLGSLGPLVALENPEVLTTSAGLAAAELAAVQARPVRALELLEAAGPDRTTAAGALAEWAARIEARARALLGQPNDALERRLTGPLPAGLALADRSAALAAAVAARGAAPEPVLEAIDTAAAALERAGFGARARRLALVGDLYGGRIPEEGQETDVRGGTAAAERAATAFVGAAVALRQDDPGRALTLAAQPAPALVGAPGQLTAALRRVQAEAALAAGEPEAGLRVAREGLLDLEQADRAREELPDELLALVPDIGALGADLAGLALRARLDAGEPLERAAGELLTDLGRAVQGWALVDSSWVDAPRRLAEWLDESGCLVLSPGGAAVPAVSFGADGSPALSPEGSDPLGLEPCAGAEVVFWAGPAPAPGGLIVDAGETRRPLVRLVAPRPLPLAARLAADPERIRGGSSHRREELVTELAGAHHDGPLDPASTAETFTGPGLALSRAPLASGWMAPGGSGDGSAWTGAEALLGPGTATGDGLAAVGLRVLPDRGETERGAWLLAEAALIGGRRWALLSRRPLTEAETGVVAAALATFERNPVRGARQLAEEDPALAQALMLWSAPGLLDGATGLPRWWWAAGASALLALGGATLVARRRGWRPLRRRSAGRQHRRW